MLALPALEPVDLADGKLRVVATTSIIGDVVAQVGGSAITLTTLIGPGQDPHSYEPGARELTAVADAHLIFVNGWDLEENLVTDLGNIGESVPIIPVSANILPLGMADHDNEEDTHGGIDPHVWLNPAHVKQWAANIAQSFSLSDPANSAVYEANAAAYLTELAELEEFITTALAPIPEDRRLLVTNHDALGYFAHAYKFEIVGAIIPGISTLAEPSASDLSALIGDMEVRQICTIFTETAVNDQLAQVVASELQFCDDVAVLPLHTGALGTAGSDTDSYLKLMRRNVETIVVGLG